MNSEGPTVEPWGTLNIKIFQMKHSMMKYSYYYVIKKVVVSSLVTEITQNRANYQNKHHQQTFERKK